ncbi:AP-3 complex subunit beta [Arthrobotrys conoides]|uniref:AP-3 complex subunit beta n=2 Tax=Arthrobotrys conoides TaxID=74498 RepID=A0AAN8RKK5_9PEZI
MESFSKISNIIGQARDLTIEAATSASGSRTYGTRVAVAPAKASSPKEIHRFLSSRHDRDILDGLRRVVSMMSRGVDCSEYFADVVKNVASPTLEIKKLVYIYLLTYAESEPDLALLSINTIQKALTDQNQVVRAMAIRVMSGIRVPVISQIVALGIKRCVTDMSPYVRKAAALAIPKCYRLDPSTLPLLTDLVATLLGDKSYYVIGAAVMAWWEVCPERIEMVHPHYRGLCKLLIDMDEWGQLALLRLLTVYARKNFPQGKVKGGNKKKKTTSGKGGFYSDEEAEDEGPAGGIDPDLKLLLDCCPPLLQSRNSAVILAVARAYYHLAPSSYLLSLAPPLLSLLRSPQDIQLIALTNIVFIALRYPSIFSPHCTHFLLSPVDTPQISKLKLEALTLVYPYSSKPYQSLILTELSYYAGSYDKELVREAVKAIGRCAQNNPEQSGRCLKLLMEHIHSSDQHLVAESLTVIRHIIQQQPTVHKKTVIRLAKALDTATSSTARASIIWLVAEFSGADNGDNVSADVLRILAKGFADEAEAVKLQILLLAAKVYAHYLNRTNAGFEQPLSEDEDTPEDLHPIPQLFNYISRLARYDVSYDIRDRARMYMSLLSTPKSVQLATLILLAPKPVPFAPSPSAALREGLTVGSSALMVGKDEYVRGYVGLPDWVSEEDAPGRGVRDPVEKEYGYEEVKEVKSVERKVEAIRHVAPPVISAGHMQELPDVSSKKEVNGKSLDEWLEGSDEEEEDDDEEEDEEEEEDDDDEEESEYETESGEEETDDEDVKESSKMLPS